MGSHWIWALTLALSSFGVSFGYDAEKGIPPLQPSRTLIMDPDLNAIMKVACTNSTVPFVNFNNKTFTQSFYDDVSADSNFDNFLRFLIQCRERVRTSPNTTYFNQIHLYTVAAAASRGIVISHELGGPDQCAMKNLTLDERYELYESTEWVYRPRNEKEINCAFMEDYAMHFCRGISCGADKIRWGSTYLLVVSRLLYLINYQMAYNAGCKTDPLSPAAIDFPQPTDLKPMKKFIDDIEHFDFCFRNPPPPNPQPESRFRREAALQELLDFSRRTRPPTSPRTTGAPRNFPTVPTTKPVTLPPRNFPTLPPTTTTTVATPNATAAAETAEPAPEAPKTTAAVPEATESPEPAPDTVTPPTKPTTATVAAPDTTATTKPTSTASVTPSTTKKPNAAATTTTAAATNATAAEETAKPGPEAPGKPPTTEKSQITPTTSATTTTASSSTTKAATSTTTKTPAASKPAEGNPDKKYPGGQQPPTVPEKPNSEGNTNTTEPANDRNPNGNPDQKAPNGQNPPATKTPPGGPSNPNGSTPKPAGQDSANNGTVPAQPPTPSNGPNGEHEGTNLWKLVEAAVEPNQSGGYWAQLRQQFGNLWE